MKKYQVIYADPAWKYDFAETNNRKIENQYPTMELEEIKNLPIKDIADVNCVLYMWATAPKLIEALEVIKAWGFEYKTHAIWDKETIGMGYWFRGQHELILVATKGQISPPSNQKRKSSIFRIKKTQHSRKPNIIRTLISEWYPELNKVELFARQRFEGWDIWGNDAPKQTQVLLSQNRIIDVKRENSEFSPNPKSEILDFS
jgi:N6-adenosine-specific RNA methylase IME4